MSSSAPPIHRPRVGAVALVAVLAGFLVWPSVIRDDESGQQAGQVQSVVQAVAPFVPDFVSRREVKDAAERLGHETFWAGSDDRLELTVSGDGRVFVRYLSEGTEPGAETANFLTVASYPLSDPVAAIENTASLPSREAFVVLGGGSAVTDPSDPNRVYFTLPASPVQVEVFHPNPGRARELVGSGEIKAII